MLKKYLYSPLGFSGFGEVEPVVSYFNQTVAMATIQTSRWALNATEITKICLFQCTENLKIYR